MLGDRMHITPCALQGMRLLQPASARQWQQTLNGLHGELGRIAGVETIFDALLLGRQLARARSADDLHAVHRQNGLGGLDLGRGLGDAHLHALLLGERNLPG